MNRFLLIIAICMSRMPNKTLKSNLILFIYNQDWGAKWSSRNLIWSFFQASISCFSRYGLFFPMQEVYILTSDLGLAFIWSYISRQKWRNSPHCPPHPCSLGTHSNVILQNLYNIASFFINMFLEVFEKSKVFFNKCSTLLMWLEIL